MATTINHWDFDPDTIISCTACDWSGRAGDHVENYNDLDDVTCPNCASILLIVPHPTRAQTEQAAARGNPCAQALLDDLQAEDARRARWRDRRLETTNQLPDLTGDVEIEWDFELLGDEPWQVLRHEATEIWREPAFWESADRFTQIFELLHQRYGRSFVALRPTAASELYLYGDDLHSVERVTALNNSGRTPT